MGRRRLLFVRGRDEEEDRARATEDEEAEEEGRAASNTDAAAISRMPVGHLRLSMAKSSATSDWHGATNVRSRFS